MTEPEEIKDRAAQTRPDNQGAGKSPMAADALEALAEGSEAPAPPQEESPQAPMAAEALAALAGEQEAAQADRGAQTPEADELPEVFSSAQSSPQGAAAVDALAALAGGQEAPSADQQAQVDPQGQGTVETADVFLVQQSGLPSPEEDAARKARASALRKQSHRVHAEQFKRLMVPLLTVTGVVLLILGLVVASRIGGQQPPSTGRGFLYDRNVQKVLVIAAFPLGAILLAGAWLFRMDLKRADNNRGGN